MSETAERYKRDFQTPAYVGEYMVSLLEGKGITKVCEPTPGQGNLVKCLLDKGYHVTAPLDYFLMKQQRFDAVIGNPPFSAKYAFLENATPEYLGGGMSLGYQILFDSLKMSDNVIMLMPWVTISDSDVRLRALMRFGLKSVTLLPRKTFQYARIQTCVFELQKGYNRTTEFKVFDTLNDSN